MLIVSLKIHYTSTLHPNLTTTTKHFNPKQVGVN
jgi:hypothetical protein